MTTTYWFDGEGLLDRIRVALEDALDEAAERVVADAKQRAPIRKVFREQPGFRFRTRRLTESEKHIAIRLANKYYKHEGLGGYSERRRRRAVAHVRYSARVTLPSRKSMNTLAHSRADRQLGVIKSGRFHSDSGAYRLWRLGGYEPSEEVRAKLTARGLSEVRSGAAVHVSATGRVQIGGALKASIGTLPVQTQGSTIATGVVADIEYARYVEFPTIHNRAQPFLLPALKDEQRTFVHDVATAVKSSLGR